jgi:hypothetical protein
VPSRVNSVKQRVLPKGQSRSNGTVSKADQKNQRGRQISKSVATIPIIQEKNDHVEDPTTEWTGFRTTEALGNDIVAREDGEYFHGTCAMQRNKHDDGGAEVEWEEIHIVRRGSRRMRSSTEKFGKEEGSRRQYQWNKIVSESTILRVTIVLVLLNCMAFA